MISHHKRKIFVFAVIILVFAAGIISFTSPVQPRYKNLKVLPQDISHDSIEHVMDGFKAALGVKCGFCHAPSKTAQGKMDPASDDNPRKNIARTMMRMTNEMNEKYISLIPQTDTAKLQVITCYTCHRGKGKPDVK